MADSLASSSSSDSDDDFLTLNDEGESRFDREALVRKKLLENFYGKSVVAEAETSDNATENNDNDYDNDDFLGAGSRASPVHVPSGADGRNDLDSADFDVAAHTQRHVVGSSLPALLATEDKLALQVRTLDSTMQTLVYENYSRFIDATDAIRSIGVNVQANKDGLDRLTKSMQSIDENSRSIEDALGTLRDQVAEKIRVKRLLTRLDFLLKLPQTLRSQMAAGNYRSATTTYLSASSILSKHSEGFESLKTIETECKMILEKMKDDLSSRLQHWSGRVTVSYEDEANITSHPIPVLPKDINEIFECAGTLELLYEARNDSATLDETAEELQSLSLSSSLRFIDRLLDAHIIEVQDRRYDVYNPSFNTDTAANNQNVHSDTSGSFLVPTGVLNAIADVSSLFVMTFRPERNVGDNLIEFVSEAFSSFVMHVKSILLEECYQSIKDEDEDELENKVGKIGIEDAQDGNISSEEEISGTLSVLVHSVQDLASALTSPEVNLNAVYASSLVDQVVELSESMVKRSVEQNFIRLRQSIVKKCLMPFVTRAVEKRKECMNAAKYAIHPLTQLASVMLSDCLQLVDDTIRSIVMTNASTNLSTVKEAVQHSVIRFTSWLANIFEIIAGGEASDSDLLVEPPESIDVSKSNVDGATAHRRNAGINGDTLKEDETVVRLVYNCHKTFLLASGESASAVHQDIVLAMAELCRLAAASVSTQLDQSISAHLGGNKKKLKGMFPSGDVSLASSMVGDPDEITIRFRASASRLIVIYATNRGSDAASVLCEDIYDIFEKIELEEPLAPRDATWRALEIVKNTSLECVRVFGGKAKAQSLTAIEVDMMRANTSTTLAHKSGLQLDVERMFKAKSATVPYPSTRMEASREVIVYVLLSVAFRSFLEQARAAIISPAGLLQMQIDCMFLKTLVPHYIDADFKFEGANASNALETLLEEIIVESNARCEEAEAAESESTSFECRAAVQTFMSNAETLKIASKFTITDAEESAAKMELNS